MQTQSHETATRQPGLTRLDAFLPTAGSNYARSRNLDPSPDQTLTVSELSPFFRRHLLTKQEVTTGFLAQHSQQAAEKFISEVFWRSYWKGWLELRPVVWQNYQAGLQGAANALQTQTGLKHNWTSACTGETGIACFSARAKELQQTGYLNNHSRIWFTSIWIFTLRLPRELGADFFLRHLLDDDPASNTLGWRWVAGLQTAGKIYLARPDNIKNIPKAGFTPTDLPPRPRRSPGPRIQSAGSCPPLIQSTPPSSPDC